MDKWVIYEDIPKRNTKVFQIIDYVHHDIKYASAVMSGNSVDKNDLIDLYAEYENDFLREFSAQIATIRLSGRKFMFVIDITPFPYIHCYLDFRAPDAITDPADKFLVDLNAAWNLYDIARVITIVVNVDLPHTGLKLLTL